MNKKQKKMLTRILITVVLLIALQFIPVTGIVRLGCYLAAYLIIGYDILKKAGKGILNRQIFDENFLMAVATVGAFALAIYEKNGDYNDAIAVMLLYQIGELFQSYAVGKSRQNISALMDIRPDYANVEVNGALEKVDPDDVEIGTIITVVPGEKVPIDGIVVDGDLKIDQAALNGESEEASKVPYIEGAEYDVKDLLNPYYAYRGTVVCGGEGYMEIKVVGDKTLFGELALEVQEETRETPLQVKLSKLAQQISTFGYIGAIAIVAGILAKTFISGTIPTGIYEWIRLIMDAITV